MAATVTIGSTFNPAGIKKAQRELLTLEAVARKSGDATAASWLMASRKIAGISGTLSKVGASLTRNVTLPIALVSAGLAKLAMDAVESENLFEVSMGDMSDAARAWSEDFSDAVGVNEYAARKMVSTFNVMLDSMGLTEEASYSMATGMSELAYDMASFYNLDPQEAFQKLQSGISGEIEPLKRLGIIVNETTIKTYALKNGIIEQGETMTEAQKVAARYNVIIEQTGKAQGDLARTLDSPTNKLRSFKEQGTETAIDFGMLLLPTLEDLVDAGGKIVDWLSDLDPGQKQFIVNAALMAAAAGPVFSILGTALKPIMALTKGVGVLRIAMGDGAAAAPKWAQAVVAGARMSKMSLVDLNSATMATKAGAAGMVVAAGLAGFALGNLAIDALGLRDDLEDLGESMGKLIYEQSMEQLASDEVVASWKAQGIELDKNNNLTDKGVQQLRTLTDATRGVTSETRNAALATREYTDDLNMLADVQNGAERADIALERAKLRLTDAQNGLADVLSEYPANSREAQDATLTLRDAELDLEDAATRVASAANDVNTALNEIPPPSSSSAAKWMAYYQAIGDKANYARSKVEAANRAMFGSSSPSANAQRTIREYGDGGYVTYPHLAIVGDKPEYIINPKAANAESLLMAAAKDMGLPLGGSPNLRVLPGGSRSVTIAPGAISVQVILQSGSHNEAVTAGNTIADQILLRLRTGVA